MSPTRAPNPGLAALLILLASAFIAASTLTAKALGTGALGPALHPLQISMGRFVSALALFAAVSAVLRPQIRGAPWGLHLGRAMAGWAGVTLIFAAVSAIPMSDATAISFLNPVFAMLLAIPLLGEKVGPVRWTAAGIALLGALVLLRPTPAAFQPGALLALGAAALTGLELIFIKTLTGRAPLMQILLINNLIGACLATAAASLVWQAPQGAQWAGLVAVGLFMACAQVAFVNGMARADASFVAPFSYATLVFAALFDLAVFGVVPGAVSLTGAAIILAGAALLAWREARTRAPGASGAPPVAAPVAVPGAAVRQNEPCNSPGSD